MANCRSCNEWFQTLDMTGRCPKCQSKPGKIKPAQKLNKAPPAILDVVRSEVARIEAGESCPTCGRKMPKPSTAKSSAERQRLYRERKKSD